ncbi:MAG TPA: 2,3-bisphosphoglycerate-independent phosphoglycerate mutase [Candidatus Paceibacterota bacterium]|jgi:2,3-bisphosphoglycerate-independent phosphoglycerate mutase|nr:2,3-bisphosphoglycerate-independent phosphoglycerate mutase [Candidatus Paceibacterota bacterium]
MARKTAVLIILDGWGIGRNDETNPIYMVKPQIFEWLANNYPMTSIQASGIAVGLPWGEVGNSEVGHLTLGAGKVLYQYYPRITMSIEDGTFFQNPALKTAFVHARENNSAVNLVGLLTKGNVHASFDHLTALIKMAHDEQVEKINLHLFSDAKDSPPHTVQTFLKEVPKEYLASLIGRYYAMDRNENWRLTETAYQTLTGQVGPLVTDADPIIQETFKKSTTEEYLPPIRFADEKKISENDSIIFFNYREDSIRQLAASFILKNFDKFPTVPFKNLSIVTMSRYDSAFDVPVVFPPETVKDPIGKVFADRGMSQLRLAETYKYAHVTYFFNGLREPPFPGEYRILIPSNSGLHPEDHPEMMAKEISDRLIEAIQSKTFDFILVNYANGDAIAHTADYNASMEAVRVIDRELTRVLRVATNPDTILLITADHGNIEELINPATGLPESQHDPSPVPVYLVAEPYKGRKFVNADSVAIETLGSLADVAPTMLELMGIEKPVDMTGKSLLEGIV